MNCLIKISSTLLSDLSNQSHAQKFPFRGRVFFSEGGALSDPLTVAEHPYPIFNDSDSLVLTVVLEFGAPDAFGHIMPVRGVGGGMVLGVE